MKKRAYTLGRRADAKEKTRRKIIEAAVYLHEEVGPRATTVSALARRAGVQRLTVYRHFENDEELYNACSALWFDRNPPPAPSSWADAKDGRTACRAAVSAFYAYYTRTQGMWRAVYRDADEAPALAGPLNLFGGVLDETATLLSAGLKPTGKFMAETTAATLGHALAFSTWQSLDSAGHDDAAKTNLVMAWLDGAAEKRTTKS